MRRGFRIALGLPTGMACPFDTAVFEQLFPEVKVKQDADGNFLLEWTDMYQINPDQIGMGISQIAACLQSTMAEQAQ